MLNEALQMQPAGVMDPEIAGELAAIGIVKDKPFNPDARMKKILTEALAVANAAMRTMSLGGRPSEGFGYYGNDSHWVNGLWVGGHEFYDPAGGNHEGWIAEALSQRWSPQTEFPHVDVLLGHRHHAGKGHAYDKCGVSVS
jgi:hypothetical protein